MYTKFKTNCTKSIITLLSCTCKNIIEMCQEKFLPSFSLFDLILTKTIAKKSLARWNFLIRKLLKAISNTTIILSSRTLWSAKMQFIPVT